jgi:hypothetical protein
MAGLVVKTEVDATKRIPRLIRGTGVTFTRFSRSVGRKVARKHKKLLGIRLRHYPPERPGQKYKRTFNLRRGWKTQIRAPRTGFTMSTSNEVEYTHHVVGKPDLRLKAGGKGQAWMHKGRWWIAGGVIRDQYKRMEQEYIDEIYDTLEEQADIDIKRRSSLIN